MFCDGCGATVVAGQRFCSNCGKQIVGPVSFAQPRPGRVQGHVRLLALFWLAFSAFNTVGAIVLYIVANTIFSHMHDFGAPEGPGTFLRPLLSVIAILLLAKAALGFIAGWGLLQHESWARILVLILGFISLFTNIPFGTALGIYTMWVLLSSDSEREYEGLATARAA
ncbi:MAG TPA: zinc ribbon domain-containing protein [Candidatus Sulfotelmatobacter sp.]